MRCRFHSPQDARPNHVVLIRKNHPMHDVKRITGAAISTTSTEPLRGIVEINIGAGSTLKFELNEDMAHHLGTQLDRFLTQQRRLRDRLARSR
jgi:hypothetical protein